jgi:hypothetical protein
MNLVPEAGVPPAGHVGWLCKSQVFRGLKKDVKKAKFYLD